MRAPEQWLLCPPPMKITVALCRRLAIDDRAQGVTEYAILIGAMALGVMAAWLATSERALDIFKSLDGGLGRLSRAPH